MVQAVRTGHFTGLRSSPAKASKENSADYWRNLPSRLNVLPSAEPTASMQRREDICMLTKIKLSESETDSL